MTYIIGGVIYVLFLLALIAFGGKLRDFRDQ